MGNVQKQTKTIYNDASTQISISYAVTEDGGQTYQITQDRRIFQKTTLSYEYNDRTFISIGSFKKKEGPSYTFRTYNGTKDVPPPTESPSGHWYEITNENPTISLTDWEYQRNDEAICVTD
eukprot:TRINITY_DN28217_c0_g1_i1.p2 TRINITY_DN28217_c0_g1~~TRINITY_DN28217_c0_g1_i1.p2  ORF type:complete len:121 (+),score=16.23 TRINITY_DN28217_c0_g1_i1:3-365(+)